MKGFDLLREVRGCFTAKVETELISEGKDSEGTGRK